MTKRVAILISGGGSNMVSLVDSMTGDHPARPVLVLSNNADAGGLAKAEARGHPDRRGRSPPVRRRSRRHLKASCKRRWPAIRPDIICLAGFMRVLTEGFVRPWQGRMLNIHPSLLPKYRGLHTHARALEAGDAEAGCTVHEVTAELDEGPILGQARVPVLAGDTPDTLAARVLDAGTSSCTPPSCAGLPAGDRSPIYLP